MKESNPDPSVSVVIPTRNRAGLIMDAVHSALAQGPVVGEVIVVDDGSTDETPALLARVADGRLRVFREGGNGPAAARNRGWRAARGPWIQFLDSDDMLSPGALDALLALARAHPGRIPFGMASVQGLKDAGPLYTFSIAHRSGNLVRELASYQAGTILSCLLPKSVLEELEGFSCTPETHWCEDFDLALRLAVRHRFEFHPEVTYRIRMHADNRHRPNRLQVWQASVVTLDRCLGSHPRYWHIRHRAKAFFLGLIADDHLAEGNPREARRGYLRCLRCWPAKLGAWRGLLRTLRPTRAIAPAAPSDS